MRNNPPASRFAVLVLAALSLTGGVVGSLIGRAYGTALSTTPAWVGPAILIGALVLIVVGLLLLPAGIRAARGGDRR